MRHMSHFRKRERRLREPHHPGDRRPTRKPRNRRGKRGRGEDWNESGRSAPPRRRGRPEDGGGEGREGRRCPATHVEIARKVALPADAVKWAAEREICYVPPGERSGANGRPAKKVAPVEKTSGAVAPRGATKYRRKCAHAKSARNWAEEKVARKTKSGHGAKCGSTAALRLKGSIFVRPWARHGAIISGIWRWAQKMSPAQVAATLGLCPHVITDLYHSMRLAAMWGEYGFGRSGVAGGRRPYCGNRRGIRAPPKV